MAQVVHDGRGLKGDVWEEIEKDDKDAALSGGIAQRLVPAADAYAVKVLDGTQSKSWRSIPDLKQIAALGIGIAFAVGVCRLSWLEAPNVRDWLWENVSLSVRNCPRTYDLDGARGSEYSDTEIAQWFAAGCATSTPVKATIDQLLGPEPPKAKPTAEQAFGPPPTATLKHVFDPSTARPTPE